MRTVEQIIDYCNWLDEQSRKHDPLLLSREEIKLIAETYAPDIDCEPIPGKAVGSFMGRTIYIKDEWPGSMLWSIAYSKQYVPQFAQEDKDGPLRLSDHIRAVTGDFRYDRLEP